MKKGGLYFESFLVLLLTLIITGLLYVLSLNVNLFNVFKKSYKKIDLIDLYYAKLKTKDANLSEDVVLVNIAEYGREEIAEIISIVSQQQAKVIGLDIMFSEFRQTASDTLLRDAIGSASDKIVAAYSINSNKEKVSSHEFFGLSNHLQGYANFINNDTEDEVVRKSYLRYALGQDTLNSFAYTLVHAYNPMKINSLKSSELSKKPAIINYSGYYDHFMPIEGSAVLAQDPILEKLKDKLVILGYFGNSFTDQCTIEDKYHSPMNIKGAGYYAPDMYGALIHANITEMMLNNAYIKYWPSGTIWVGIFSIIMAYPIIVMFTYFFVRRHLWYHVAAKLTQLILGIIIIFLVLNVYEYINFKLELKFFLLLLAISVDVLYLYEALMTIYFKKTGKKSYFIHEH